MTHAPASGQAPECGLQITIGDAGTTRICELAGAWSEAAGRDARLALQRALEPPLPETLVLDLSAVSRLEPVGIGAVLQLHRRCRREDVRLAIIPGPPSVQRVFERSAIGEGLPFAQASGPASPAPAASRR